MAQIIKLKRRAGGGAAGAPAALKTTEPAYNETDDTLYIGYGDDGAGNATSVRAIAGAGTFATRAYVTEQMANAGVGDMLADEYDTDGDGKVNAAETADEAPWAGITGKPATFAPSAHTHPQSEVTNLTADLAAKAPLASPAFTGTPTGITKAHVGLGNVDNTSDAAKPVSTAQQTALNLKANLASPAFTGTPTAPTQAAGNDTTRLATTAFVQAAVQGILGLAPADLDTLAEIAARIQSGESDQDALVASVAAKMAKAANLSDVADVATARSNLGLGSMALQNAGAVAITGGTIDNVTVDGGTF